MFILFIRRNNLKFTSLLLSWPIHRKWYYILGTNNEINGHINDTISNATQVKPARLPTRKASDEDNDTVLFGLKTGIAVTVNDHSTPAALFLVLPFALSFDLLSSFFWYSSFGLYHLFLFSPLPSCIFRCSSANVFNVRKKTWKRQINHFFQVVTSRCRSTFWSVPSPPIFLLFLLIFSVAVRQTFSPFMREKELETHAVVLPFYVCDSYSSYLFMIT